MQNSVLIPVAPLSSPVMSGQIISLIKDSASPLGQIFISLSSGEKWKVVSQLCLTLCDPMDYCSLPGSSTHGILQARILEWVASSFSRGSSWPRDRTQISCIGRQILYCLILLGSPSLEQTLSNGITFHLLCCLLCPESQSPKLRE